MMTPASYDAAVRSGSHGDLSGAAQAGVRRRVRSVPVVVPPVLSASQLARLGALGEERTGRVGEALYRVGDRAYPFIAILEGEVVIVDAAGHEIVRHGPSGFLGEMNLPVSYTHLTLPTTERV